jgi:hypothetical protein
VFFRRSAGRSKTPRNVLRRDLAKLILFCFLGNRFGNANNGHGSHSGSHCGVRFRCPRFGSHSSSETSIWPPRESLGIRQTNFHMAKTPLPDLSTSSPKIRRSQGCGRSGSAILPARGGDIPCQITRITVIYNL